MPLKYFSPPPRQSNTYVVGSKSFRPDQLFKVTEKKTNLLFFNIVSLYFNTLFNWYINLTIDGTIYPFQHFPFGATFICQAGNFWILLHTISHVVSYIHQCNKFSLQSLANIKLLWKNGFNPFESMKNLCYIQRFSP